MNRLVLHWIHAWVLALVLVLWPANCYAGENVKVWVNTNSGVYHCPGGRYYGVTKRGKYINESNAVASGYRAAYGNACSPDVAQQATRQALQSLAPSGKAATTRVWINTGSHVYHCPSSRYYGVTKKGHFASEAEAVSQGNRPAYGQRCN